MLSRLLRLCLLYFAQVLPCINAARLSFAVLLVNYYCCVHVSQLTCPAAAMSVHIR